MARAFFDATECERWEEARGLVHASMLSYQAAEASYPPRSEGYVEGRERAFVERFDGAGLARPERAPAIAKLSLHVEQDRAFAEASTGWAWRPIVQVALVQEGGDGSVWLPPGRAESRAMPRNDVVARLPQGIVVRDTLAPVTGEPWEPGTPSQQARELLSRIVAALEETHGEGVSEGLSPWLRRAADAGEFAQLDADLELAFWAHVEGAALGGGDVDLKSDGGR